MHAYWNLLGCLLLLHCSFTLVFSLRCRVYDDVVPLFQMLVTDGVKIFSLSADSSEAQKLLFTFSNQGDILEVISSRSVYLIRWSSVPS